MEADETARTRHEEVEERPELQDIILDRRAAEHQPMLRLHPLRRLRTGSLMITCCSEGCSSTSGQLELCIYSSMDMVQTRREPRVCSRRSVHACEICDLGFRMMWPSSSTT